MRRKISTTVSDNAYKMALVHGIPLNEAFEAGVKLISGMSTEVQELQEDIKNLEGELKFKKHRLGELQQEAKENKVKEEAKIIGRFE